MSLIDVGCWTGSGEEIAEDDNTVGAPSDILTVTGEALEMTIDVIMDVCSLAEDETADDAEEAETEDVEFFFTASPNVTAWDRDELATLNHGLVNFLRAP